MTKEELDSSKFIEKFKEILNISLGKTAEKFKDGFGITIEIKIPHIYERKEFDKICNEFKDEKYVLSQEFTGKVKGNSLWFLDDKVINFFKNSLSCQDEQDETFVRNYLCEIHNIFTCSYIGEVFQRLHEETDFEIVNIYNPKELLEDIVSKKLFLVETMLVIDSGSTNLEQVILLSDELYENLKTL